MLLMCSFFKFVTTIDSLKCFDYILCSFLLSKLPIVIYKLANSIIFGYFPLIYHKHELLVTKYYIFSTPGFQWGLCCSIFSFLCQDSYIIVCPFITVFKNAFNTEGTQINSTNDDLSRTKLELLVLVALGLTAIKKAVC